MTTSTHRPLPATATVGLLSITAFAVEPAPGTDSAKAAAAPSAPKATSSEIASPAPAKDDTKARADAKADPSKDTYYLSDYLSTTLGTVDAQGVIDQMETDAFGAPLADGRAPARFTGKPYDEDMGAYIFPFRNYRPESASWMTPDPSGFPNGTNAYHYAAVPGLSYDSLGLASYTYDDGYVYATTELDNGGGGVTFTYGSTNYATSNGGADFGATSTVSITNNSGADAYFVQEIYATGTWTDASGTTQNLCPTTPHWLEGIWIPAASSIAIDQFSLGIFYNFPESAHSRTKSIYGEIDGTSAIVEDTTIGYNFLFTDAGWSHHNVPEAGEMYSYDLQANDAPDWWSAITSRATHNFEIETETE